MISAKHIIKWLENKNWVIKPLIIVNLDNTLIDYELIIDGIIIKDVMQYFVDRFGYHDFYRIDQYIKEKYHINEESKRYS